MSATVSVATADHQVSLNLIGAFPQGEFKDQISAGAGVSGGYTYGFPGEFPAAFRIGADAGFIMYGNEVRHEPFSSTIPDVVVEVETSNNILQFGGVARLEARQGALRPYFEARAGFSYFYTETRIRDLDWDDDEDIASSKNFDDLTTYRSVGAGVLIPVYEGMDPSGNVFSLSVDLRFTYLWGEEADYLKEGSIGRSGDAVVYDVIHSRTDMTIVHAGISVGF